MMGKASGDMGMSQHGDEAEHQKAHDTEQKGPY
jgi:hypothetical protein